MSSCFYCGTEASEKCPDCNLVSFCSPDHFVHHKHEDKCQPFYVEFGGEDVGRFLRATRDIKPFETVLTDRALALGIFDDSKPICLSCYEKIGETGSVPCPFCRMPMCDDPKCLDSDRHKPECEVLRRHQPDPISISSDDVNPVYALIGPLRIRNWKLRDPVVWKEILSLASHVEERKKDLRWSWVLNKVVPIAKACGLSDEDIEELGEINQIFSSSAKTQIVSFYSNTFRSLFLFNWITIFSVFINIC